MKRAKLIQALESKSSDHQQELERAFAKAVEMQQKAEEKALALTTELTQTERKNQDEIKALTEQVFSNSALSVLTIVVILYFSTGKFEAHASSAADRGQICWK